MNYTIEIDLENKTAELKKVIAAGEKSVPVSVVNIGSHTATNLRLRLIRNNVLCAEISALSVDGVNASGTLDLSGSALASEFIGVSDRGSLPFTLCISDTTDNSLLVNQRIFILNNPDV